MIMIKTEKIIERLKLELKIDNDTKLANYLGINQSTLATWKKNNSFDVYRVFNKLQNININWLLTGEGEPYIENKEKLKQRVNELEQTIKNIDIGISKDNKEVASLDIEVIQLRNKLAYAEELIFKLANR